MSPSSTQEPSRLSPAARLILQWTLFQLGLAALLFGTAGTWRFWQAWAYLGIHFVTTSITNVHLIRNDPALLLRRLKRGEGGETEPVQRFFQQLVGPLFLALLATAGLDHRFGWSSVPSGMVVAGQVVAAAGYVLVFFVFRENTYCSSVVEVDARQSVVASGPYRFVRHPMYAGAALGALGTPIALGSYWAATMFAPITALLVVRLLSEERFLRERLRGYVEYTGKTRHRLVPGAW